MDNMFKGMLFWIGVVAVVFALLSNTHCRLNIRSEPVEPNQVVVVPGVGQWKIIEHRGIQTLVDPNGEVVGLVWRDCER